MIGRLKKKINSSEDNKALFSNIMSLAVLQGANYILPLLTVPYLVRVLGPEYFGLLAFATATIMYFMLITDYGFNLSATRQVAIHRNDSRKLSEIYSSVMLIKASLLLLSLLLLTLLVFSIEKFKVHWQVYYITFGMVVGQLLFPVWLFQGLERMKYITYLNIAAKLFFTSCTFLLVKNQDDYLLVPLLTSCGFIVAGLFSLYFVRKEFNVRMHWQSWDNIKYQLVDGWHVFFSSIAISLYTISTTFILGVFTNNTIVGYFAAADKIIQAVKGLYQPVSQAIYPLVGRKLYENKDAGLAFVRKVTKFVSVGMLPVSTLLYLLAEPIVYWLLGEQYQESVVLLQIMAFLPLIIALSNIFGIQTMLNLGYKQAFSRIILVAAILGVGLSLAFVPLYQGIGTAVTLLIVEVFVTVVMYIYLNIKIRRY